ncbi:hypothetical protein ES703_98290 [subsurface metagenome]
MGDGAVGEASGGDAYAEDGVDLTLDGLEGAEELGDPLQTGLGLDDRGEDLLVEDLLLHLPGLRVLHELGHRVEGLELGLQGG